MSATTRSRLENGWRADTAIEDTVLRRFVHNQADVNAVIAGARGGRTAATDDVFLADADCPVPYLNQAILARPLTTAADPVLDRIESLFAAGRHPVTLLSVWPTPDLGPRGWSLLGHPAFVLRAPGAPPYTRAATGAAPSVQVVRTEAEIAAAERVAIESYPLVMARGLPPGAVLAPALLETALRMRIGLLEGRAVAIGNNFVARGVNNLCLAATHPAARRRGVWERLLWSRVADAPDLPTVAYTSDDSRPGFLRMGFLAVTRLSLWSRDVPPT
jgi:hypothetical protein